MDTAFLQQSAEGLVARLTEQIDSPYGSGFMSPAIYDTAWVSMVSKTVDGETFWLFPECFEYLLQHQHDDGSWIAYASSIDGILNTAASLLALKRHLNSPYQMQGTPVEPLIERIDRATAALQTQLDRWEVDGTVHVGFELLVPALLDYLAAEGVCFTFPGRDRLFSIRQEKLARFQPEYLYLPVQTPAVHSLEAFIGSIDFDRLAHHKIQGSFMASPSSTAAFLMYSSHWDDDCEQYLRHVLHCAAGHGSGGVPSAFPSTIFELTWGLSTLLGAGFDLQPDTSAPVSKACAYLASSFTAQGGTVGFLPGVGADADDTAKTILTLRLLDREVSCDPMLDAFETRHHFRTYPHERDPSFSANCNVLLALVNATEVERYTAQIDKASRFLYTQFRNSQLNVRDKWNLSPFYSWMLMAQAVARLWDLWHQGGVQSLSNELVATELPGLLSEMVACLVNQQNTTGSWGARGSREETAYAVLTLAYAVPLEASRETRQAIRTAIVRGSAYLASLDCGDGIDRLWVEKVTYGSEVLSEAYTLAALKKAANLLEEEPESVQVNGVSAKLNGVKVEIEEVVDSSTNGQVQAPNGFQPKIDGVESDKSPLPVADTGRHCRPPAWTMEQEQILLGPFEYLETMPGKGIRSQFIHAFNTWLQIPGTSLEVVDKVVSMLHTASLLVDDIEDNSNLRRGLPTAHRIFGTAQTFNSGNYVYFLALREIESLRNPQAVSIYVDSLIHLHRGQGMDLFWRDSQICPTEEEYLDMVANKTGGLFCLAVQLMQAESSVQVDFVPLVRLLGVIFQICDDYLNLQSTTYTHNKGLCEDLTEGKFSFPIIHSIRANPGNRQLINILKQKPEEDDIKRHALAYMETTNTFQYTRDFVRELKAQAMELIEQFEQQGFQKNHEFRRILARMSLD
ncbi:hypothetical protein ASPZODRAFT_20693 [Penicilliopsis zonata CBS 506.65]|uniref:Uncharacterized protein n=1 Tax=Penicilliopsis zonata CBS 506.65 TaxID=1073090 RepID=A0A1L9S4V7_9EURO|nr:hypothetical protein ASPZODRAFT_20693 [Penicilliopsis zonata CBS 506.65]OJJ42193.1 hypothetical protein ASPZODRAFT_20693 [Penicilliopsis zonata CBS 506.65]